MEGECKANREDYKCANCDRNHSSFYRGCQVFNEAKHLLLSSKNKQTIANTKNSNEESIKNCSYSSNAEIGKLYTPIVNNENALMNKSSELLKNNN